MRGIPQEMQAKAREILLAGDARHDWAVAVVADAWLTGGRPRAEVQPLSRGPSLLLDRFVEENCLSRHGNAKHDPLACVIAAYYARLARDEQLLRRLAAERGEHESVQLTAQNSSTSSRQLQIPLARGTVPGGPSVEPPASGPTTPSPGENTAWNPKNPTPPATGGAA